jgi:hypothetical protein
MHSYLAMRGGDPREYVADINGFLAQEVTRPASGDVGFEDARQIYRAGSADLNTLKILRSQPLRQVLAQPEYFWTLQDGAGLLRRDPRLGGKVLALDMANPLNAVTGRSAPAVSTRGTMQPAPSTKRRTEIRSRCSPTSTL